MTEEEYARQSLVDCDADAERKYRSATNNWEKLRALEDWVKIRGAISLLGVEGIDLQDLRQIAFE